MVFLWFEVKKDPLSFAIDNFLSQFYAQTFSVADLTKLCLYFFLRILNFGESFGAMGATSDSVVLMKNFFFFFNLVLSIFSASSRSLRMLEKRI